MKCILVKVSTFLQVKEQSLGTLCNLSADENIRGKVFNPEILPLFIKFLQDEDIKVKEIAGAVLANLALSHSSHKVLVEAGVIPALVRFSQYLLFGFFWKFYLRNSKSLS